MRLFIRRIMHKLGYDIVKYNPSYITGRIDTEDLTKEFKWLKDFGFKTILDVGANEGQFADKMVTLFPNTFIYAFEPIPETFDLLCRNFKNSKYFKGINVALGDTEGEISFNKNEYSPSSSLLDMSQNHLNSFEYAAKTNPIKVKIEKLDHLMKDEPFQLPLLVKLDVQGFEDKVIRGGTSVIQKADLILCEVSFSELYKGQPLFSEIYDMFRELGFNYAGNIEQLRSPETNLILQADAVFIKSK